MKIWVLLLIALLALATVIVWTLATAALYRRGRCRSYPYYWCDTKWQCCSKDNNNENCDAAGGSGTHGSYKITDKFYGTNTSANPGDDDHNLYYHLCIAPANAIIATYPGESLACLYSPGPNGPIACPSAFNSVPGYNANSYPGDPNGLQGRCTYANIDDAGADPTVPSSYSYLPGYSNGSNTSPGNGYYQQPYLGTPSSKTNYFFAGNSAPGVSSVNSFNNGPNQADSTYYSAWNRLGFPKSGVPP